MGAASSDAFVEDVELSGHIIDSLLLPKVLDIITALGGSFELKQVTIGHHRTDPSYALIQVQAPSEEQLQQILDRNLCTNPGIEAIILSVTGTKIFPSQPTEGAVHVAPFATHLRHGWV